MAIKLTYFLIGLLFGITADRALADPVPDAMLPAISGHVLDQSGSLDPKTASAISDWLASFQKRTGNQVLVVIVEDPKGRSIEDWAAGLLRRAVAHDSHAAVLVVAPKQQAALLGVGDGLKTRLPPDVAARIVSSELTKYDSDRLSGEILRIVTDVLDAVTTGHISNPDYGARSADDEMSQKLLQGWPLLILVVLLLLAASVVRLWFRRSLSKRLGENASDAELDGPQSIWWSNDTTWRR